MHSQPRINRTNPTGNRTPHSPAALTLLIVLLAACTAGDSLSAMAPSPENQLPAATAQPSPGLISPTEPAPTGIPPTTSPTTLPSPTEIPPTPTFIPTATPIPASPTTILPTQALPTLTPTSPPGCPKGCTTPPPGCVIKGNISSKGEKIYHMPGQRYYNATIIEPSKGERWFCTEAEALANGWRKSKV